MKQMLAVLVSLAAVCAHADATYYVSMTGNDSNDGKSAENAFRNPQTAIDLATGQSRVTVKIAAGTYTVKNFATDPAVINITNSNVFVEAIEPGTVFIDGGSSTTSWATGKNCNRAVAISDCLSDVTVKGIVFQNGITSARVQHNVDPYASTLFAQSGIFLDCKFIGKCLSFCSAMWLTGTAVASNCVFTLASQYGSSDSWGQYAVTVYGGAKVIDSTFEELWRVTKSPNNPMCIGGSAMISNCVIRNTVFGLPKSFSSTRGYGSKHQGHATAIVYMSGGSMIGCTVTNNHVYGSIPVVYVNGSSALLRNNIFWNNVSDGLLDNVVVNAQLSPTVEGNTAPEYTADANNTSFEPWQEFCTSNSVAAGRAPFKVRFRNRTNNENAVWDFGDGSESVMGATPEHTYEKVGKYTVKMTLGGTTTTRTDYIVATGPKMYVSKTGAAEKPYDTPDKAARHPQDAIDLAPEGEGVVIEIDDGTYTARTPTTDDTILRIQKSGVTVKAKNGEGHVWIDSQRTCSNGLTRNNIMIGRGLSDIIVDSLVFTNGYACSEKGPSCALLGSGVFTNCTFDIYRLNATGGIDCDGTTRFTRCRLTGAAPSLSIDATYDYALGLAGSSCLEYSVVRGISMRGSGNNFNNPVVNLSSSSAVIRNCLVVGCTSGTKNGTNGRGAIGATAGTIENCTIVGNEVKCGKGGGVHLGNNSVVFRNNIVWGNTAPTVADGNDIYVEDQSGCTYSASPDLDATEANHNVKLTQGEDPGFTDYAGGDYSLKLKTLLTGSGSVQDWMEDAVDLKGLPRLYEETVSMGAYEPQGRDKSLLGDFSISGSSFGAPPFTATFAATVSGGSGSYLYQWDFGDGTVTEFTADAAPTHTYTTVGGFDVTLTVTDGTITNSLGTKAGLAVAVGETCYLRPDQAGVAPYDTWEKATSNIEAAVALQPKTVLATNGVYYVLNVKDKFGLKLDRAITVKSVEGPEKTTISLTDGLKPGNYVEFRNATLSHDEAVLDGFSLSRSIPPALVVTAGLVKNCIVTNAGQSYLDGIVQISGSSVMSNCVVDAKGAKFQDTCNNASIVQASGSALIVDCEFRNLDKSDSNQNPRDRGGLILYGCATMRNCYVHDVSFALAAWYQDQDPPSLGNAGIYALGNATVDCCTVTRCWSKYHPGGGINAGSGATIRNCIVSGNTGGGTKWGTGDIAFDMRPNQAPAVFENNLVGVITNDVLPTTASACLPLGTDPQFVTNGPAYRIERTSPCRDAGRNLEWCRRRRMATDFEGRERHMGHPDIGCWEYPVGPGAMILIH